MTKKLHKTLPAAALAAFILATPALAHGPGGGQYPMGAGMMGYGQTCPAGTGMMGCRPAGGGQWGSGMMGPGMMGPGMMGPGMMGSGMMGSGMMGPGMMGPGMMGPGMMGPGMMGPGMMGYGWGWGQGGGAGQNISVEDARRFLEQRLAWQGNKRLELGEVKQSDDDTIVAEIVTQDGSLVERLEIDRRTGQMRLVQ